MQYTDWRWGTLFINRSIYGVCRLDENLNAVKSSSYLIEYQLNFIFFRYSWISQQMVAKILQSHDINCSIIFFSAIGREHQEREILSPHVFLAYIKTCMSRKMKCKRSHVHSIWTFFLCAPLTYRPSINQAVAKGFIFSLFFSLIFFAWLHWTHV